MKLLFKPAAYLVVPMALLGCGDDSSKTSALQETIYPELNSAAIISRVETYEFANSNPDSAQVFLEFLEASGEVSWGDHEVGDNYIVFEDIVMGEDVKIDQLSLKNFLSLNEEIPFPTDVKFEGLENIEDETEIGSGHMIFPNGQLFRSHVEALGIGTGDVQKDLNGDEFQKIVDVISEYDGAGYLENLSLKDTDESDIEIEFFGWESELDKTEFSFVIEDLVVDKNDRVADPGFYGNSTSDFSEAKIETIKIKNINLDWLGEINTLNGQRPLGLVMYLYNPFNTFIDGGEATGIEMKADPQFEEDIVGAKIPYFRWYSTAEKEGVDISRMQAHVEYIISDNFWVKDDIDREHFKELGLLPFAITVDSESRLDEINDKYQLKHAKMSLSDKVAINLSMNLEGVDAFFQSFEGVFQDYPTLLKQDLSPELEEEVNAIILNGLDSLNLKEMSVTISEYDLLEPALKLAAEIRETDVEELRTQMSGAVSMISLGAQTEYQSELAMDYIDAAESFIAEGGGLRLKIMPSGGFRPGEIYRSLKGEDPFIEQDPKEIADEILKFLNIDFQHIPN